MRTAFSACNRGANGPAVAERAYAAHPALRQVWEGIRRTKGTRQTGKAALLPADLRAMVAAC